APTPLVAGVAACLERGTDGTGGGYLCENDLSLLRGWLRRGRHAAARWVRRSERRSRAPGQFRATLLEGLGPCRDARPRGAAAAAPDRNRVRLMARRTRPCGGNAHAHRR